MKNTYEKLKMKYASNFIKILIASFLLIGSMQPLRAQYVQWAKQIGGISNDVGRDVAVDGSGNILWTGNFQGTVDFDFGVNTAMLTSAGNNDVVVAKYDASGNYIWAKALGGSGSDIPYGIAADNAGNVYVTGSFTGTADFNPGGSGGILTSAGNSDIFMVKYTAGGSFVWAKSMGGSVIDEAYDIAVDGNSNVYVTGRFSSAPANFNPAGSGDTLTSAGNSDVFVAKYDVSGNYLWAISLGGAGADVGEEVAVDGVGNVYVTGYFSSISGSIDFNPGAGVNTLTSKGGDDVFFAKYDTNGNYLWAISMGGSSTDRGVGVAVDATGDVFLTGRFRDSIDFDPGPNMAYLVSGFDSLFGPRRYSDDIFLAKYNAAGNYLWAIGIGGGYVTVGQIVPSSNVRAIAIDERGNAWLSGAFVGIVDFDPGPGTAAFMNEEQNAFVAKYDAHGNYLWTGIMGGMGGQIVEGLASDGSGNVYATGYFLQEFSPTGDIVFKTAGSNDAVLLKLNSPCGSLTHITQVECDSFTFNGTTYTSSGVYTDTFPSSDNCDSIVTITLTLRHSSVNPEISGHYCDSVTFNGITYTRSGLYTQEYENNAGCDSNITYNLTIGSSSTRSVTAFACDSFLLNDTAVYTITGNYTVTLTNKSGCDSMIMLDVTIGTTPNASAVWSGGTLTAAGGDAYQWVDCDNNYSPIPGATEQTYMPPRTTPGNYAVIVTRDHCSDTSTCIPVEAETGIKEPGTDNTIRLYPNPAKDRLTIQSERDLKYVSISLVNIVGQVLEQRVNQQGRLFTLDMNPHAAGVYFVEVTGDGEAIRRKVIKE